MSTMASGGSSVPLAIRSESSDSSGPLAPSDSVLEFKPTHRQPYAFHYAVSPKTNYRYIDQTIHYRHWIRPRRCADFTLTMI